jgi:hypothetical protein
VSANGRGCRQAQDRDTKEAEANFERLPRARGEVTLLFALNVAAPRLRHVPFAIGSKQNLGADQWWAAMPGSTC